jgi:hypothetical protein
MSRPSGPSAGSPAIVVAAPRGGEEGRHVGGAGEADVVGREGRLRRRLVAEGVAEGRLPAAGEVEDGPVQERQQALHGWTSPLSSSEKLQKGKPTTPPLLSVCERCARGAGVYEGD